MPLTSLQKKIAKLLSRNRSPDSHLAGGAALLFKPNSKRYSADLDYFNDSVERVASAFSQDQKLLLENDFSLSIEIKRPGYIRALVLKGKKQTKIEWSHDTDWRFMPVIKDKIFGYRLHPIDVAINKVLALAGRNEPRDYLDTIYLDSDLLPLGALCWAAAGKDPGFTPFSLLELLKRRGKFRQEDFNRLKLVKSVEVKTLKKEWLKALTNAEQFINERPHQEVGCLYFSITKKDFFAPNKKDNKKNYVIHYGRPGGVLPKIL